MANEGKGWMAAAGHLIWRNWITLFGSSLTTVSVVAIAVFVLLQAVGITLSPYIGILIYLVLPTIFIFGLLLIPAGAYIDLRRRGKGGAPLHLDLDFNSPRIRKLAVIVGFLTLVNVLIVSAVSYQGAVYMESTGFCGQTCHTVMEPEFTAHAQSPHARVRCVECHIGPGVPALVHAKLNGLNQVYGVLTDSYERPIPVPVPNLAPAERTCSECHNPGEDLGDILRVTTDYSTDEANTPLMSVVMMHVGGRGSHKDGIHSWHLAPGREIYYYATDEKNQVIEYVKVTNPGEADKEYFAGDSELDPATLPEGALRRMDCTDCHNRATHKFQLPAPAMNEAMVAGLIDPTLPSIKAIGVETLENAVEAPDGLAFIATTLSDYYAENHAEVVANRAEELNTSIEAIQKIYSRNIFPKMKIGWGTYPDYIGHTQFDGCFRCHDDGHASRDGAHMISQDCTSCHNVVAWQEENPDILTALGLQ